MPNPNYTVTIRTVWDPSGVKKGTKQSEDAFANFHKTLDAGRAKFVKDEISAAEKAAAGKVNAYLKAGQTVAREEQKLADQMIRESRRATSENERGARARTVAEQRAAREVQAINDQTRRQAEANERIRERAAKQLADVQIREAKRAAREIERTLAEQQRFQQQSVGGSAFLGGAIGGFLGGVTLGAVLAVTSAVKAGASAWLDYSSKLQNNRIAFEAMLGSADLAEDHLRSLQQFALETPFQFLELTDASQRMQALGFATAEVIPLLRSVGNAVAAAGGGSERLERVIKALADVRAKEKIQTQEIRQFAEAGISAYKILQLETGKTVAEIQKMVEAGEITADIFIPAFQKFSDLHFGDLMEKQSRTFAGAMSNIKDALLQTSSRAFEPLFQKISEISVRIADEMIKGKPTLYQTFSSVLGGLVELTANVGTEIGTTLLQKIAERISSPGNIISSNVETAKNQLLAIARGIAPDYVNDPSGILTRPIPIQDVTRAQPIGVVNQRTAQEKLNEVNKKALEITMDLAKGIVNYSQVGLEAVTRQKLMLEGVTDLTSGYAAFAVALARSADQQRIITEQQQDEERRVRTRNEGLVRQLEVMRDRARLEQAEIAAGKEGLEELERFNFTLGAQVEGLLESAKATGQWTEELQALSTALALTRSNVISLTLAKADQKTKEEADKVFKARLEVNRTLAELAQGVQEQLTGESANVLDRTARAIEKISGLKFQPGSLESLSDLIRTGADAKSDVFVWSALTSALSQMEGIDPNKIDATANSIIKMLQGAANVDVNRAFEDSAMGRAQEKLREQWEETSTAIAVVNETSAMRYQIAWQDAINEVTLADQFAREEMIRSQVLIADQSVFHADRANEKVMKFLAAQRGVTDIIADARISVIQSTYDIIDRGLDRFTKKLGAIGSVLKDVLSGFIRLALNKAFQMILGGQTGGSFFGGGGQQSGGGGLAGGIGGFVSNLFRPQGGGALTGGFAGGPGGGGFFGGGGITTPQGAQAAALAGAFGGGITVPLSSSLQNPFTAFLAQGAGGATGAGTTAAAAAGKFSLSGLGASLGPILPLLGLGLGASAGGASGLGSVLGGAGGLIAGGVGAAFLAPGMFAATGAFGSMGPAIAGLLTNPFTAIAAGGLIVTALILAKNAARRRDEKTRNEISGNTGTAIWDLIGQAQRGEVTVSEARTVWTQIEQQYKSQIATLKDSKTRRHAEQQWVNDFAPLWSKVEQNAREQQEKKSAAAIFESAFVPTFAGGGLVPFFGGMKTLIKVRPGERIDDVGLMRSWMVPGHDTGRDSVLTMASPGSAVRTRSQQSIPGFASGSGGGLPEIRISEMNITIDSAGMVKSVMRSPEGRKITVDTIRVHIDREGSEGIAGDLDPRRKR